MIVVVQSREKFLADKEKAYQAGLRKGRADRIEALEAENERLREALEPFTFRNVGDDEIVFLQYPSIILRCEVTYGDIQLARAALGEKQ